MNDPALKLSDELRAYLRELAARYRGGAHCRSCLEWRRDLRPIDGVGHLCGGCRTKRKDQR